MPDRTQSHPFLKLLLDAIQPVVQKCVPLLEHRLGKTEGEGISASLKLSPKQQYDRTVFWHLSNLYSCLDRLNYAREFMRQFPRPRTYERKGVNQHAWLQYHYSSYAIFSASVSDISLLLVNAVFRLGIPQRLVKADLIKKNEWVGRTAIPGKLSKIEGCVKSHRRTKNLLFHEGELPQIAEVFESPILETLALVDFVNLHSTKPFTPKGLVDLAYSRNLRTVCETLRARTSELQSAVADLLDDLSPVYSRFSESLRT